MDHKPTELVTKKPSTKVVVIMIVLMLIVVISVLFVVFMLMFATKLRSSDEETFRSYVSNSIVGSVDPTPVVISNTLKNSITYQNDVAFIRNITNEYTDIQVKTYQPCQVIKNIMWYDVASRARYCSVSICDANQSDCIYVYGYMGNQRSRGRSSRRVLEHLEIFVTKANADLKHAELQKAVKLNR